MPAADLARALLAAVMVAVLFSPPVTTLLELSLIALMLGSRELRGRLARAAREPLAALALAFLGVVALGLTYSSAPWKESFGIWLSWRKLLLLPIGMALFDDVAWKRRLAWTLVLAGTLCVLASFLGVVLDVNYYKYEHGVVIRNHSTQGMVFAVAAFAAALLARYENAPGTRRLLIVAAVLLVANIALVTPGRSGYAVLIVVSAALALTGFEGSALKRVGAAAGTALLVGVVLAASPVVRERMILGVSEIEAKDQGGSTITAMGQRVIYARNTLELIAERPLIGHGTGAFEAVYGRKVEGRPGMEGLKIHDPHNQFLKIAAEHGLIGLLVFLALLGAAFLQRPPAPYRVLGLGVLAAWCVTSLFSSHFSTFSEGRFILLWMGAFLAQDAYRSA